MLFKGVKLGPFVDYPWFCTPPYLENNKEFTVLLGLTIEHFHFIESNLDWIRNRVWMMTVLITALLPLVMKS